jgi:hypothetical protein
VVGVERLDDDGVAEALGGLRRRVGVAHERWRGTGRPSVAEDAVGLLLVRTRSRPRCGGSGGDGGLDALLVAAVAELDERLVVEADPRDVAASAARTSDAVEGPSWRRCAKRDQLVELS